MSIEASTKGHKKDHSHNNSKAFAIDYTFIPEADVSVFDTEEKLAEIDDVALDANPDKKFGYEPFNFVRIQNYNPIYSLFFKMRETNYNKVALNHKFRIVNSNQVMGSSGEIINKAVHFKFSPLIDYLMYMTAEIETPMDVLPTCDHDNSPTQENRIMRHNNMAYTDGFFYYLSSKMMHTHNFVHGLDFYGSFVGIQRVFKFDLWDDMYESICSSKYFNDNLGKLFHINLDNEIVSAQNDLSTWSRANRPAIEFSGDELSPEMLECENINVSMDTSCDWSGVSQGLPSLAVGTCQTTDLSRPDLSLRPDLSSPVSQDGRSLKTIPPMLGRLTNIELNCELNIDSINCDSKNDNNDEDEEEDEDEDEEEEELEEDDDNITEDEEDEDMECDAVEAYIPNFPVHVICIEKCEGLFEDLLKNRELNDDQCIAAMAQIVFALLMYQRSFQLTHNDLHTRNIMYVTTDVKYLYYKYNHQVYRVPTYGRIFKIIDFGRAIYKYRGKILCSDSYSPDGEAEKLYNTEPYFDNNKKRVDPNPSFDLCRLATSVFDISENRRDLPVFRALMRRWCMDDRGKNVYVKNNGSERYPGFKLYMMIARTVHEHTPENQLKQKEFKRFLYNSKSLGEKQINHIMDINSVPNYTI